MATNTDGREEIKPVAPTEQTKWRDPSLVGKYMVDPKTGLAGLFRSPDNGETWVLTDTVYGHVYNQDEVDNIWDNGAGHKVADEIKSATADLPNVRKQADEAVKFAESAIAASKVNSDAIVAQSSAVVEAKSAMDSATAEIQQLKANAASDVAQIEATIAEVQVGVNQAKSANESAVQAVQAELKSTSDSMDKVEKRLDEVDTSLDAYAKSAAEQGHDITLIKQKQGQFEADFASAQGNVNQIQADIKGLRQNIKDNQGNIATLLTSADKLQASMKDAQNNISNLLLTASKYEQTFKDQDGRLSKVEQTATEHTSELADAKGNIDKVTQKADSLQLLLSDAQKNIQNIQLDAKGIHDTLTGQGNQLATLNITVNNFDSKYSSITGNLQSKQTALSTEQKQTKDMLLNKADKSEVDNVKGTVSKVSAEQKVMADQISSKVSSADYQKDKTDTITAIEKNTTAIDENSKLISLTAKQTDVDKIKGTAQQLSSRLDVMADQIKSKVTSTDVNNIVDGKGYATTSTVQSLIDQKAGTLNESITNLSAELKNNSGGGVNLLLNSGTLQFSANVTSQTNNPNSGNSLWHLSVGSLADWLKDNPNVTKLGISYDYELTGTTKASGIIRFGVNQAPVWEYMSGYNLDGKPLKGRAKMIIDVTDAMRNTHTDITRIRGDGLPIGATLKIDHPKWEIGAVTPYSQAPSDNATVTQFQSVTASIDGLQSRVTNYQNDTSSKYTQLSNMIQSKVSASDFNALKDKATWKSTDSIDLNNAVSQQKIFVKGGSNLPPGGYWWYVQVEPGYDRRIVQYAVSDRDNIHYSRQYDGSKWSAWSQGATESEITQLRDDINLRVKSGDLLSQINLTAGNTLIQSNKLYLDASSVVFSGRAFIPSAAIAEIDADKLTFYGNGTKATIGAGIAEYDQDKVKSTISMQYSGGFEIHSSNELGSILTMHDNTVRLAVKSQVYGSGSGQPLNQQYSGVWFGSNYTLMNTVDKEGKTTGWAIGSNKSGANNDYRAYFYDNSTSVQPNYGVGIGTTRFDVYAGNSQLFLGPDKGELRGSEHATLHGGTQTYVEGGNEQIYIHDGEVNIGNPNNIGSATGVHLQVFGWATFNGYVEAMGFNTKSTLSSKTRITPLDTADALDKITSTDLTTFQYKTEVAEGFTKRHAGPIIDDVNDVAQYRTPNAFISENRQGRSDADIIGYLMGAVQELTKQLNKLKKEVQING